MTITKTEAIRQARRAVSAPVRRSGTDYVVYGPYRYNEPRGARTETQHNSYPAAVISRAKQAACVALALMSKLNDETHFAVESAAQDYHATHTVEALVAAGLAADSGAELTSR